MCETKVVCQCFTFFLFFFEFLLLRSNFGQLWSTSACTYKEVYVLSFDTQQVTDLVFYCGILCGNQWYSKFCNVLLAPPLQKRPHIHNKLQNHHFFLNNSCNSQYEDSLSWQDAPMCQIWSHLGNFFLGYGHDPSHLPYVRWTFYPIIHICEEMCKSVGVTQVS